MDGRFALTGNSLDAIGTICFTANCAPRAFNPETIANDHFQAQQSAIQQNAFKTKNENIWVNQKVAWINMVKWDACADPELDIKQFAKEDCRVAIDLASKTDTVSIIPA